MSVFGSMFDEYDDGVQTSLEETTDIGGDSKPGGVFASGGNSGKSTRQPPITSRPSHGLCGILNRGATCYLNSLLQTLVMTPEFRQRLFLLGPDELGQFGNEADMSTSKVKLRIIPVQLQWLFARLLLLDVSAVSTEELTASFGWTNQEERDQHDVQELNRILFSAIEDSLVGTVGESLIRDLYHGTMVNTIQCAVCGRTSERVEDFLDLCISTAGSPSLIDGLARLFLEDEILNSSNQYRCDNCGGLTDAVKRTKVRRLPPILTISLLRFSYDPIKMDRVKETSRFAFPHQIDMSPFCESWSAFEHGYHMASGEVMPNGGPSKNGKTRVNQSAGGDFVVGESSNSQALYELFSVVVHRGGAHGGHYHALIKDVNGVGTWCVPEVLPAKSGNQKSQKNVRIDTASVTPQVNNQPLVNDMVDSPQSVVIACLKKAGKSGMSIDTLCSEMLRLTGVSWKNRFKKKNGSLLEFIRSHTALFVFNEHSHWVTLCDESPKNENKSLEADFKSSAVYTCVVSSSQDVGHTQECTLKSGPVTDKSTADCSNSEINGSVIHPVVNLSSAEPEPGHCWFGFNDSTIHAVHAKDIEKYFCGKECAYMLFYRLITTEESVGVVRIPDYFIHAIEEENKKLLQERSNYEDTINLITVRVYFSRSYEYRNGALHLRCDSLPYLEQEVDRRTTVSELLSTVENVGGEMLGASDQVIHVARDLPAGIHLYQEITGDLQATLSSLHIVDSTKLFVWDGKQVGGNFITVGSDCEPLLITVEMQGTKMFDITIAKNLKIDDLKESICCQVSGDKEHLILKDKNGGHLLEPSDKALKDAIMKLRTSITATFTNQLMCTSSPSAVDVSKSPVSVVSNMVFQIENRLGDGDSSVFEVEVDTAATVEELKLIAFSAADIPFEMSSQTRLRIEDVGSFVLGPPLHESANVVATGLSNGSQLVLERGVPPSATKLVLTVTVPPGADIELCVERNLTVHELKQQAIERGSVKDGEWHLCRADWAREAGAVLPADQTVGDCDLRHGDHLLLQPGCPPPAGFIRLSVFLSTPDIEDTINGDSSVKGNSHSTKKVQIESVMISKQSTLIDLKNQIATLNALSQFVIPSPLYIRLRSLSTSDVCPGNILRHHSESVQKLKLVTGSAVLVEMLQDEEDLSSMQMPLTVRRRIPSRRAYSDCTLNVVWDISQGATLTSLRHLVAGTVGEPDSAVRVAKHVPEKFEWRVIADVSNCSQSQSQNGHKKVKKGKKKAATKKPGASSDLRQGPYFLQDCDVLGVKVIHEDGGADDDFGTPQDDLGLEEIRRKREEMESKRKEAKLISIEKAKRRPETAIKIHVDNFR